LVTELVPSTITNWGFEYFQGDKEDHYRVLPKMIRNLLPNADAASGAPAFTSEEFDYLFNVPSNDA
jgi:hypothetical protein